MYLCQYIFFTDADIERNVQNIILPLDRLSGPLDYAWGAFKALYTVQQNDSIATAYSKVKSYFTYDHFKDLINYYYITYLFDKFIKIVLGFTHI